MGVRVSLLLPITLTRKHMKKYLAKADIGAFFSKMYQANHGKKIEISIRPDEERIAIYYKERGTFDYIDITDENPNIDELVKTLST